MFSSGKRKPWGSAKKARQAKALANPLKSDMVAGYMAREKTSKAQDKAEAFGCEYTSVFLAGWFKINGCAACKRHDPRGFHPHHTIHRNRKGKAESLTPLCPTCHHEDGEGVEANARNKFGVDLFAVANQLSEAGAAVGYLPVEECEECGAFHSSRFLIDELNKETGEVRRICEPCAPSGPI